MRKYKINVMAITIAILIAVGAMNVQASILPTNVNTTQLLENGKQNVNIIALSDIYDTASQVNENLMKQKSLVISVKGTKKDVQQYVGKLQNVIKTVNQQGVLFQYEIIKNKNRYSILIDKESASLYYYSVKFTEKIYNVCKDNIKKRFEENKEKYLEDCKLYPDEHTLRMHIFYATIIDKLIDDDSLVNYASKYINSSLSSTDICYWFEDYGKNTESTCTFDYDDSQFIHYMLNDVEKDEDTGKINIEIISFEKFMQIPEMEIMMQSVNFEGVNTREEIIMNHLFSELSDAMKVFVLDYSRYFSCDSWVKYSMMYVGSIHFIKDDGACGMKTLYENKACGACDGFASYEILVFSQWGIESCFNNSYEIDHAWSVVKVKNSNGKILWIPFDYGIGPARNLRVSTIIKKRYLHTEEDRYKLYLSGIKGAPKYRNFVESDFN